MVGQVHSRVSAGDGQSVRNPLARAHKAVCGWPHAVAVRRFWCRAGVCAKARCRRA